MIVIEFLSIFIVLILGFFIVKNLIKKDSLKYRVHQRILKEHKDLYPFETFFEGYFNYLSQKGSWWLVFVHVLFLFAIIGFISFDFLKIIDLPKNTADILIDQRTSNVATIISMTLAVIGLLLSNLAIKDAQTYKIIFVKSKLFLVVYYTISVIFCLIIISTLRDTLQENIFRKLVLAGTFLCLLILFGIAYLFRIIIEFANQDSVFQKLMIEFVKEGKKTLYAELLERKSKEEFVNLMDKYNVNVGDRGLMGFIHFQENVGKSSSILIYDLKILLLENILIKQTSLGRNCVYSQELFLNKIIPDYNNILFIVGDDGQQSVNIKSCVIERKPSKRVGQESEYKLYFDKKMKDYVTSGNSSKVKEILDVYREFYNLQMKNG